MGSFIDLFLDFFNPIYQLGFNPNSSPKLCTLEPSFSIWILIQQFPKWRPYNPYGRDL
jgi:hypothetical protein